MLPEWKVLVLNSSFEPLQFCTTRRAVVMVLKGRAVKVELDGHLVRSPSVTIQLPTVIRLMRYVRRPYRPGVAFSKKNVFKRDQNTCQYCGASGGTLTLDHVIPRSRGGATVWENVVLACQRCNTEKGDRPLHETTLSLLRPPVRPGHLFFARIAQGAPVSVQAAWAKYLAYASND
ncbi:MAG: HNH endonuclease [Candidatus Tectimicrobiota bacterium]